MEMPHTIKYTYLAARPKTINKQGGVYAMKPEILLPNKEKDKRTEAPRQLCSKVGEMFEETQFSGKHEFSMGF